MSKRVAASRSTGCRRIRSQVMSVRTRSRGCDRGSAMIVSIMVVLMATSLGMVGMYETLNGSYSAAVTGKSVQVVAAGRAGEDAGIGSIESEVKADDTYVQTGTGTAEPITCQSGSKTTAFNAGVTASNGAGDSADQAWYSTVYATSGTSAANAASDLGETISSGWTAGQCATTATTIMTESTFASQSAPWWLAIKSTGSTSSSVYNTAKSSIAVVEFTPEASGSTPSFSDGVYVGNDLTMSGNFQMNEISGGPGSPPGIPTYTSGSLDCQNTGDYEAGDVWAGGTGSSNTSGSCVIGNPSSSPVLTANLYIFPDPTDTAGTVTFANSTTVTGTVYATGNVSMTNGTIKLGNIATNGAVTINGSATPTIGNIYAVGNVSINLTGGTISGNVYSESGTATVTANGGTFKGHAYSATAWPTSPSPCAGSEVTCASGGAGLVTPFPSQTFPSLSYSASQWPGYTVWTDPNDTKTYANGGCSSKVGQSGSTGRYAAGVATNAVYTEIENATSPTVIETPCAIQLDDGATNGEITIKTNIAIFAQGGFYFDNWTTSAVGGSSGSIDYSMYFIVPYTGSGPYPVNGEPAITSCPPNGEVPNVYQYKSGSYSTGDIWLKSGLASNVYGFFYTPDNACTSGNPTLTGQVYVGGNFATGSGWNFTADEAMSSGLTEASSSNSGESMTLDSLQ
jgi:hypothetical protein